MQKKDGKSGKGFGSGGKGFGGGKSFDPQKAKQVDASKPKQVDASKLKQVDASKPKQFQAKPTQFATKPTTPAKGGGGVSGIGGGRGPQAPGGGKAPGPRPGSSGGASSQSSGGASGAMGSAASAAPAPFQPPRDIPFLEANAGKALVDLTTWILDPISNPHDVTQVWRSTGQALGTFSGLVVGQAAEPKMDFLMAPLTTVISAQNTLLSEEMFFDLIDAISGLHDGVKQAICQWLYDTYQSGDALVAALIDGGEEVAARIWQWILMVIGLLGDWVEDRLAELFDVLTMIQDFASLGAKLADPNDPNSVWAQLPTLWMELQNVLAGDGLLKWLLAQAEALGKHEQTITWPLTGETTTVEMSPLTDVVRKLITGSAHSAKTLGEGAQGFLGGAEDQANQVFATLGFLFREAQKLVGTSVEGAATGAAQALATLNAFEEKLRQLVFHGGDSPTPWTAVARSHNVVYELVGDSGMFNVSGADYSLPTASDLSEFSSLLGAHDSFMAFEVYVGENAALPVPAPTDISQLDWQDMEAANREAGQTPLDVRLPFNIDLGPFSQAEVLIDAAVPESSIALAHLPEFYVIDMRYHMPYGSLGFFTILDPLKTGYVTTDQVDTVLQHWANGTYDPGYDVNQDGIIDGKDYGLACAQAGISIEEREDALDDYPNLRSQGDAYKEDEGEYVAGVMYRKVTGPLGLYASLTPMDWTFLTFTELSGESIPGERDPETGEPLYKDPITGEGLDKIARDGLLTLVEGQIRLPIPDPYQFFANPDDHRDPSEAGMEEFFYPVRYHFEGRYMVDTFGNMVGIEDDSDEEGAFGWGIGPVPSAQWDLVVRGGHEARDWQLYAALYPFNPLLRTWTFKLTFYIRALLTGLACQYGGETGFGVAGKTDFRISVIYDTGGPLIEVLKQWAERLQQLQDEPPQFPEFKLPIPWQFLVDMIEYTEVPRITRNMIAVAGPFLDLLFEWTDGPRYLRGVLGHIRQTVLNKWTPAPAWIEVEHLVREHCPTLVDALTTLREELRDAPLPNDVDRLRCEREDAIWFPDLVEERLETAAQGQPGAEAALDAWYEFREERSWAASLDQLVDPGQIERARSVVATSRQSAVDPRFNIIPIPAPPEVDIPLCGRYYVLNPHFFKPPMASDIQAAQSAADGDEMAAVEAATQTRGNPFFKPVYHTVIEFGPDAKLFSAPRQDAAFFMGPIGGGTIGIVEASRVLEDQAGDMWAWVRLPSWEHGWIRIPKPVWQQLVGEEELPVSYLAGMAQSCMRSFVDPRKMALVDQVIDGMRVPQPIMRLEPSARGTMDETQYAHRARKSLLRSQCKEPIEVNLNPDEDDDYRDVGEISDSEMRLLYENWITELRIRVLGYEEATADELPRIEDVEVYGPAEELGLDPPTKWSYHIHELTEGFNALDTDRRERLWSSAAAWMKCTTYVPFIAMELAHTIIDALFGHAEEGEEDPTMLERAENLGHKLMEILGKCADFSFEEVVLACQLASPAILDLVMVGCDLMGKLKKIMEMVQEAEKKKEDAEKAAQEFEESGGEYDVSYEGGAPPVGSMMPGPAPEFQNMGAMLLRLLIAEPEPPKPAKPVWLPPGWDDIRVSFEAHGQAADVAEGQEIPEKAQTVVPEYDELNFVGFCLGSPRVIEIAYQIQPQEPEEGEPAADPSGDLQAGDVILVKVSKWGAFINRMDESGQKVLGHGCGKERIPEELKDQVRWFLRVGEEEGATFEPLPELSGIEVEFELEEAHAGQVLTFKAAIEIDGTITEPEDDLGQAIEEIEPVYVEPTQYVFAHETITVTYTAAEELAQETVNVVFLTEEGTEVPTTAELSEEQRRAGKHAVELDLAALTDDLAGGPFFGVRVELPEGSAIEGKEPPPEAEEPEEPEILDSGSLRLQLGQDTITINWTEELGAGGGAGDEVGAGASISPTGNIKFHPPQINIPYGMLLGTKQGPDGKPQLTGEPTPEVVAMFLHFAMRFLYHSVDALEVLVHVLRKEPEDDESWVAKTFGLVGRACLFLVFAMAQALCDLANDYAGFIVQLLSRTSIRFQFDALISISGAVYVNFDANETIKGQCELSLASVLAPFIKILMAANPDGSGVDGSALASMVSPHIEAELRDHFCVKVGGFPAGMEIESCGVIGKAKLGIPPDSPLQNRLIEMMEWLGDQAVKFRQEQLGLREARAAQTEATKQGFDVVRMILDLIDKNMQSFIVNKSPDWGSVNETLQFVMEELQAGESTSTEGTVSAGGDGSDSAGAAGDAGSAAAPSGGTTVGAASTGGAGSPAGGVPTSSKAPVGVGGKAPAGGKAPLGGKVPAGGKTPAGGRTPAGGKPPVPVLAGVGASGVDIRAEQTRAQQISGDRWRGSTPEPLRNLLDALDTPYTDPETGEERYVGGTQIRSGKYIGDASMNGTIPKTKGPWLLLDDAEKDAIAGALSATSPPREVYESVRYAISLPGSPQAVSFHTFLPDPEDDEILAGIVAGFADEEAAKAFLQKPLQTEPPVPTFIWDRPDGRHYAWVDTEILPQLEARGLPFPELAVDGNQLLLTFRKVPHQAIDRLKGVDVLQNAQAERVILWQVPLLAKSVPGAARAIRDRLKRNRGWNQRSSAKPQQKTKGAKPIPSARQPLRAQPGWRGLYPPKA